MTSDYKTRGVEVMGKMVEPKVVASLQPSPIAPELNDLLVEHAMGMVWARPGLSLRDRSLMTISILIALRAENELRAHIPIGLTNGLTREEIAEMLYHATVYAGYPAVMTAHKVALEVMPKD